LDKVYFREKPELYTRAAKPESYMPQAQYAPTVAREEMERDKEMQNEKAVLIARLSEFEDRLSKLETPETTGNLDYGEDGEWGLDPDIGNRRAFLPAQLNWSRSSMQGVTGIGKRCSDGVSQTSPGNITEKQGNLVERGPESCEDGGLVCLDDAESESESDASSIELLSPGGGWLIDGDRLEDVEAAAGEDESGLTQGEPPVEDEDEHGSTGIAGNGRDGWDDVLHSRAAMLEMALLVAGEELMSEVDSSLSSLTLTVTVTVTLTLIGGI